MSRFALRRSALAHVLWLISVVLMLAATPAVGQQVEEPLYQQLVENFQKDYLRLGVLLQTVADAQLERSFSGTNGFTISNFRVALSGELDQRFGYFLQTTFVGSPAILDASMYFRANSRFTVRGGQFKAPFSREFLTPASAIDFVNRAQVVTALAPGRQLGMSVAATTASRTLGATVGLFNGNGTRPNSNDNGNFLYAARVAGTVRPPAMLGQATQLDVAANIAHSRDESVTLPGIVTGFSGTRTLFGVDATARSGPYSFSGEILWASLDPEVGTTRNPWGLHVTAGYMLTQKTQALIRFDGLNPDNADGRRDLLIVGFNTWPTTVTEFQINYLVDPDDSAFDHHQLLINMQFGF